MSDDEVKDKVRSVLSVMKSEWRFAMFQPPGRPKDVRMWLALKRKDDSPFADCVAISTILFDVPPFTGDWRESLVER